MFFSHPVCCTLYLTAEPFQQELGLNLILLNDKVWYISFCVIWSVRCYYTMSSYHIDFPFMARLSSSCYIDLPFKVHSKDSSTNCTVKCFSFPGSRSSPCGCSADVKEARFNHFACKPETTWNHTDIVMCKLFLPSLFVYNSPLAGQFWEISVCTCVMSTNRTKLDYWLVQLPLEILKNNRFVYTAIGVRLISIATFYWNDIIIQWQICR